MYRNFLHWIFKPETDRMVPKSTSQSLHLTENIHPDDAHNVIHVPRGDADRYFHRQAVSRRRARRDPLSLLTRVFLTRGAGQAIYTALTHNPRPKATR